MANYNGTYATPRADLGAAFMEYMEESGNDFIASRILPFVRVGKQAATFSKLTRESMLSSADAKRQAKSGYNRVDVGAEDASYACDEFGLEGVIDDRERALYASDFDHEAAVLFHVTRKLLLAREVRVAAAIFNTVTWTGAALYTDVSAANPWDTISSDIIATVIAAIEKVRTGTGMMPNALIVGRAQFANMLQNTGIKAQFPGAPLITKAMVETALPSIFGLERLIIGGSVRNTADEGLAATLADVWSDDYAMIAKVALSGDPITQPCVGRSFLWTPDSPEELVVETYREEQTRGDVLRARHDVDELILGAEFAHLLKID